MATEKLFGLHATALQLRSQRMMLLASNIANAATPGYKARDLDFAKALDMAQQGGSTAYVVRIGFTQAEIVLTAAVPAMTVSARVGGQARRLPGERP